MVSFVIILISWIVLIIICYYFIRPLSDKFIRIVLVFSLCIFLTDISCKRLVPFDMSSILIIGACWLTSIRLISMTFFSKDKSLTFRRFLFKIFWLYFPILPKELARNEWPTVYHLVLIVIKVLLNHWFYRWLIICDQGISGERIYIFFLYMITISYMMDSGTILIRLLTRDVYTLESFSNFPLFSLSLREFWGQRYNRIVHRVLKESIFQPIRREYSSETIAGLGTFIICGVFHAHMAYVTFADLSLIFPTLMFFFLHGIACWFEAKTKAEVPEHVALLLTQAFLLITAPLMVKPSIREGSMMLLRNPPVLFDASWLPQLPLPAFCPR